MSIIHINYPCVNKALQEARDKYKVKRHMINEHELSELREIASNFNIKEELKR